MLKNAMYRLSGGKGNSTSNPLFQKRRHASEELSFRVSDAGSIAGEQERESSSRGPSNFGQESPSCDQSPSRKINTWINHGYWLSVTLKEARNLGAYDYDTLSSDPYAKMRLTLPGGKAPVITEHRTRTVHRNLSPMFEERLLCPLSGLSTGCIFNLCMYDADWLRAEFMGQVNCTLGQLLEPVDAADRPLQQWFALTGKSNKPKSVHEGEVLLEVQLLTYTQAEMVRRSQEKYRVPEYLQARFLHSQLELDAHTLRFTRRVREAKTIDELLSKLTIEIRVGQSMIRQPVTSVRVKESLEGKKLLKLEMNNRVIIPLQNAFSGNILMWDKKASSEVADIKVYLCIGSEQVFKTQVPLWAVPIRDNDGSEAADGDDEPSSASNVRSSKSAYDLLAAVQSQSPASLKHQQVKPNVQVDKSATLKQQQARKVVISEPSFAMFQEKHAILFSRPMEHYSKNIALANCILDFSLLVTSRQERDPETCAGGSDTEEGCECTVLDVCEDQEDVRDAPPLKNVPPPLETMVTESSYPCGPCRLYQLLFKAGSELAGQIAQREGLTNIQIGPWGVSLSADGNQARQRILKYTKPLAIPVPFAPKIADVTEVHTLQIKEVSGWMLEIVITTDAPKGDTFKVINQVLCMRGTSAGSCSLRVSMTVELLKNVGFLKGAIQGGAQKDTVKHWREVVNSSLKAHLEGSAAPSSANESNGATPQSVAMLPAPRHMAIPWGSTILALLVLLAMGMLLAVAYQGLQQTQEIVQRLVDAVELLASSQEQLASLHAQNQQCISAQQVHKAPIQSAAAKTAPTTWSIHFEGPCDPT